MRFSRLRVAAWHEFTVGRPTSREHIRHQGEGATFAFDASRASRLRKQRSKVLAEDGNPHAGTDLAILTNTVLPDCRSFRLEVFSLEVLGTSGIL
jgi:hypothetical protein